MIEEKIEKILDINGAVWTPPAPKNKRKAIKELTTLIQEERKEAVRGLIEYLEHHTDEIFYLGCGKMINEYLETVESEEI